MMLFRLSILVLLLASVGAAEPRPLLVVVEQSPWGSRLGAEGPTFAIYDDGSVLYKPLTPDPKQRFLRRTVPDARGLVSTLVTFDRQIAKKNFRLSSKFDEVSTYIWTSTAFLSIYGNWRGADWTMARPQSEIRLEDWTERDFSAEESLSGAVDLLLRRVDSERLQEGSPWLPASLEVSFWPYEDASEESVLWPESWPGLHSPGSEEKAEGKYSIQLASENLPGLRRLLASRKARAAVLIEGRKMAVYYRAPFPGEAAWLEK